jgi:hypothetical protein
MGMRACIDTGNSSRYEMKVSGLVGEAIWSCFPDMRYKGDEAYLRGSIDCGGVLVLTPAMCALVSSWMLMQLAPTRHIMHDSANDNRYWYWWHDAMDATYMRIAAMQGLTVVFG